LTTTLNYAYGGHLIQVIDAYQDGFLLAICEEG